MQFSPTPPPHHSCSVTGGRANNGEGIGPSGAGVVGVGVRTLNEAGSVGPWSREQVELFCISKLINCVLEPDEEFVFLDFHLALRKHYCHIGYCSNTVTRSTQHTSVYIVCCSECSTVYNACYTLYTIYNILWSGYFLSSRYFCEGIKPPAATKHDLLT